MMQPTTLMSQISLRPSSLSFLLLLSLSLWCATLAREAGGCVKVCSITIIADKPIEQCKMDCTKGGSPKEDDFSENFDKGVSTAGTGSIENEKSEEWNSTEHINQRRTLADKWDYQVCRKPGEGEEHSGHLAINVGVEITSDGEYVLRIRRSIPSSIIEDQVERAKEMAQSASLLLVQAEVLRDMGDKLLAQSRASFQSILTKPAPSNSN